MVFTVKEKVGWGILAWFLSIHFLSFLITANMSQTSWYVYGLRPFLLFATMVFLWRRTRPRPSISLKQRTTLLMFCVLAAMLYFISYFMLGFVDGFGKNPFNTSLLGIMTNLYTFFPLFVTGEMVRVHFLGAFRKKYQFMALVVIVLAYTLSSMTPSMITSVFTNTFRANVEFLGTQVLTELSKNILLSNLALMGGLSASLLLRISFESVFFFFPVIPDLKWITVALLDNMFPTYTLVLIRDALFPKENRDRRVRTKDNPYLWALTYLSSIAIVWFAVGLFPVFPTVILTGSMEPMLYPGDVAVMQKVKKSEIKEGDVIQFWAENYFIIHRIIAIEDGKYKTKGDNNNAPDSEWVEFGQVKGKVIYQVPAIGQPVLFVRSRTNQELQRQVEETYETGKDTDHGND